MASGNINSRTRAISNMRTDPGREMAVQQAATGQLMNIYNAQRSNLAQSRYSGEMAMRENALLGQGAVAMAGPGGGYPGGTIPQNTLGRGGNSRTSSRQVVGGNTVINNNNTTINNITQNSPTDVNKYDAGGTGRFKVWVSNVLNRQNEQLAQRDREYQRQNAELERNSNKMSNKLERINSELSERLDPRRLMKQSGEQTNFLLKMIGIGIVAKEWPVLLSKIATIEEKTRYFLEYIGITGRDERKKSGADSGLVRDIKYILLGENVEKLKKGDGLLAALKMLFVGEKGLIETMRKSFDLWLEDRSKAVKAIKVPNVSVWEPSKAIEGVMGYLGQILTAILSGDAKATQQRIKNEATQSKDLGAAEMRAKKETAYNTQLKTVTDSNGKKIGEASAGDASFEDTSNIIGRDSARYMLRASDVNKAGNLSNNTTASLRQSTYIANNLFGGSETGGKMNPSGILEGFRRLESAAATSGDKTTLVDPEFISALKKLGIDEKPLNLESKAREYGYVIHEKTDAEKEAERQYNMQRAGAYGSDMMQFNTGTFGKPIAKRATGWLGNKVGNLWGTITNPLTTEDYTYRLEPVTDKNKDKLESLWSRSGGGNKKNIFTYYALTQDDINYIKGQLGKLVGNTENFSFNAEDAESTRAMANYLLSLSPNAKLTSSYTKHVGSITQEDFDKANGLKNAQRELWSQTFLSGAADRAANVWGNYSGEMAGISNYYATDYGPDSYKTGSNESFSYVYKSGTGGRGSGMPETGEAMVPKHIMNSVKSQTGWNVDAAVEDIKKHTKSGPTGYCWRHVGHALSTGFGEKLSDPGGGYHTGSDPLLGNATMARWAGSVLKRMGFEQISLNETPRKGDIRVYQPKNPNDPKAAGHVEMFDGTSWYSDFKQSRSSIHRTDRYSSALAFRWKGGNNRGVDSSDVSENPDNPTSTQTINKQENLANITPTMSVDQAILRTSPTLTTKDMVYSALSPSTVSPVVRKSTIESTSSTHLAENIQPIQEELQRLVEINTVTAQTTAGVVDSLNVLTQAVASQGTQPTDRLTVPYLVEIPGGQI